MRLHHLLQEGAVGHLCAVQRHLLEEVEMLSEGETFSNFNTVPDAYTEMAETRWVTHHPVSSLVRLSKRERRDK